jgi:WhiB family transcriptional regulator, redox-sensing transcriptional regulator
VAVEPRRNAADLPRNSNWRARAACLDCPPELFFPNDKSQVLEDRTQLAKQVCRSCDVSEECLSYALRTCQEFGIWGGTDEKDRARIRHRQRVADWVYSAPRTFPLANGAGRPVKPRAGHRVS